MSIKTDGIGAEENPHVAPGKKRTDSVLSTITGDKSDQIEDLEDHWSIGKKLTPGISTDVSCHPA